MLCDDCRELIRQADQYLTSSSSPSVIKREVSFSTFQAAIHGKCYLCTRLYTQLGPAKWQHILSDLPETTLIAFDKSANCHPSIILVRLGCKLTPITGQHQGAPTVPGKGYSYGYLQVAVLPWTPRWAIFPNMATPTRTLRG